MDKKFYNGLKEYIDTLVDKDDKKILEYVMDKIGYIPEEVQDFIVDETGMFKISLKNTIEFYEKFKETKDNLTLKICVGMSCGPKGGKRLYEEIKNYIAKENLEGKIELLEQRCFGRCNFGPNISVDGVIYQGMNFEKVKKLLEDTLKGRDS